MPSSWDLRLHHSPRKSTIEDRPRSVDEAPNAHKCLPAAPPSAILSYELREHLAGGRQRVALPSTRFARSGERHARSRGATYRTARRFAELTLSAARGARLNKVLALEIHREVTEAPRQCRARRSCSDGWTPTRYATPRPLAQPLRPPVPSFESLLWAPSRHRFVQQQRRYQDSIDAGRQLWNNALVVK